MNCSQKVASVNRVARIHINRVARIQKKVNFVHHYEYGDVHFVEARNEENKVVGTIKGELYTVDSRKQLGLFECGRDLKALYDLWKEDVPSWKEDGVPILEITNTFLDEDYRSQGLGIQMYKEIASYGRDEAGMPMFFIPGYCGEGETNRMARRVWKSLARSNSVSSDDVILMIERKLR